MDSTLPETTLSERLRRNTAPVIVAIAGDSGCGKTTYSDGIRRILGPELVTTIEMDGYHAEDRSAREISGRLPLDPACNRFDLLSEHLRILKNGEPADIPVYDHSSGTFGAPRHLVPTPVVILEGLHALYPRFAGYIDFSIYVDAARDVKWQWKFDRDTGERGHGSAKLTAEMHARERAYKQWIDFQKTFANVVVKISPSMLASMARYEFDGTLPVRCYRIELIMEKPIKPLSMMPLPFDLGAMMDGAEPPFLLAGIPSVYWGRNVMDIMIDGVLSDDTVRALETGLHAYTGINISECMKGLPSVEDQNVSSTQFAQLLVAWRFLEQLGTRMQ